MKLKCPTCDGRLMYKQFSEEPVLIEATIEENGDINFISDSSDTSIIIRCSINTHHNIPQQLQTKIIDLIEDIRY